jgi:AcrR family transcriptional regulator
VLDSGRINQKLQTRKALLRAAQDLTAQDKPVTIVAAAKQAGVSTATAYRYFNDPDAMRLEAIVETDLGTAGDFMHELEEIYADMTDLTDRVIAAHRLMIRFIREYEQSYRLFLAKGHQSVVSDTRDTKVAPRGGRRQPMMELALESVKDRLSEDDWNDAIIGICVASGPEPYFVLKDIFGKDDAENDRISEMNLKMLVQTLVTDKLNA